jgi:hypothetical protein
VSDRFAAACSLGSSKEKAALHHLLHRPNAAGADAGADAAADSEVIVGDVLEGMKIQIYGLDAIRPLFAIKNRHIGCFLWHIFEHFFDISNS